MKLIPVDPSNETHLKVLYDLLAERTPEQSISHKRMPTWEEHVAHVVAFTSRASEAAHFDWCLIEVDALSRPEGAVYLTALNEIGIGILHGRQGYGYGPRAICLMMEKHGLRKAFANVNPANARSIAMFEKRFNAKLIQFTYEIEVSGAD